ncbi:phosphotransferase [Hoeflea sp. G2-23]|uniref:Hydroxylysine kinase n=1 Tax=Hoeflea algicola TaxID=2983763 RepID=A0ABT3ZE92_9HYPH|nr:phosphotransferase [Hoeflea algicola]MCY0149614.1 phosphotransferase [Hoeflea algicola]
MQVDAKVAADILDQFWSIHGQVSSLVAERDEILEVLAKDGRHFVLKIYNSAEAPQLADLRARACSHIAMHDPSLPVPEVIPINGDLQGLANIPGDAPRVVQLMTFLDGIPQFDVPRSSKQALMIGRTLARTANALADFEHPADRRHLVWDLANAAEVRPLLPSDTSDRWAMPAFILERFQNDTWDRLKDLPSQVIHNDFNGHNLLMDPQDVTTITGIIDFGDVTRSQRVNDVAIAACYQLRFGEPGFAGACDVVAGYDSVSPLSEEEITLLPALILVRLALAVTITEFRAAQQPNRASQILKNTGYAWRALQHLSGIENSRVADQFRAACDKENSHD